MLDKLDFTVTLALFNGNSSLESNQHTYTIFIDNEPVVTKTFPNKSFGAISTVRFIVEKEFGPHQFKVQYVSTQGPGSIKVENVYVGGPSGSGVRPRLRARERRPPSHGPRSRKSGPPSRRALRSRAP